LNEACPFICRSGRTSTPGWRIGRTKQVMPRCLGTLVSVRASSSPKSAVAAPVDQTFCPVTSHPSSTASARVVSPARSEPAPGSLNSWHQVISPVTVRLMKCSLSASVPCSMSTGPARPTPTPSAGPGTPLLVSSWVTCAARPGGRERPHQGFGQAGHAQPASASSSRQWIRLSSGSQLASIQRRSSSSTPAVSGVAVVTAPRIGVGGVPRTRGCPRRSPPSGAGGPVP